MSLATARLHQPTGKLILGADGYTLQNNADLDDGCCTDVLCAPFCDTACSFISLLPSGPMWDKQKQEAVRQVVECGGEASIGDCPSLALYAVYAARVLIEMRETILFPAVRESKPATAITTLDDWLERYGWQDCYRSTCRSDYQAMFSPYEIEGGCGTEYCPAVFDATFECALKHAILLSLVRMQRGVIKNLDGINWVIAPLGAALSPKRWPTVVNEYLRGDCPPEPDETIPCFCDVAEFEICQTVDALPLCPSTMCETMPQTYVAAIQTYQCADNPPVELYPGVIAAECIVRAMLQRKCPNIIYRCDTTVPPPIIIS
jgi:hypothetical protein